MQTCSVRYRAILHTQSDMLYQTQSSHAHKLWGMTGSHDAGYGVICCYKMSIGTFNARCDQYRPVHVKP